MIYLLAASDDDPMKFVVGAIFVVIWVVSSILSATAKKREEQRRQRVKESIQLDRVLPPQLPLPPAVQRQQPMQHAPPVMLRRIDAPPRQQPRPVPKPLRQVAKQLKLRRKLAGPPPIKLPQPTAPIPVPARAPIEAVSLSPSQVQAARVPSATAATLRSWLKPEMLRQQFILTEVLQPPISLRR